MQKNDIVLAIDAGTTWCKAAYIDIDGTLLSTGRSYMRGGMPFGHGPADVARLWNGISEAVHEASATFEGEPSPAAVSIACRKSPGIWLDARQAPLGVSRESVLGAGRDAIEECYASELWSGLGPFAYGYGIDLIGNTRWLRTEHPEVWAQVKFAGNLHSWIILQLTGEWLTSPAAGPVQPGWPEEVELLTGLGREVFPSVAPESEAIGSLRRTAARSLGLRPGTTVVTGTHDGAAANIGAGAIHKGDACLTLGTNGVLRAVTGERLPNRFGYTITGDRWALVRDIVALAPHIDAVVGTIDCSTAPVTPERHEELTLEAASVPIGAEGLRLPVSDDVNQSVELTRGARDAGHEPATIYRAALEGIAIAYRGLVSHANESGATPQRFYATGGATENELLIHILSAVIGEPIRMPPDEAGLHGVAALAATGAKLYATVDDAVNRMVRHEATVAAPAMDQERYVEVVETSSIPSGFAPGDGVRNH